MTLSPANDDSPLLPPPTRLPQLLVLLVVLVVYVRVLFNPFVIFDDHIFLYMNPNLVPPGIHTLEHYWNPRNDSYGLYVPLTYTFWWIAAEVGYDAGLNQLSPVPFKLLSWFTHGLTAVLVYRLARKILFRSTGRPHQAICMFTAILWACHPMQVESVAWASGYKDLLAGFGVFLTLNVFFARGVAPRPFSATAMIAAALGFIAMLGKPSAMTVPALALMLSVMLWRVPFRQALLSTLPMFILCGSLALLAKAVQQNEYVVSVPYWMRPLAALDALAWYTYTFVVPVALAPDHARNPFNILRDGAIYWTWVLPVVLWYLAYRLRQRAPLLSVTAWWVPLGVGPVLGFVSFQYQNYTTVAEHYFYVSNFGLCLAVAAGLAQLPNVAPHLSRWRVPAGLVLLVLASIGTVRQLGYWRETEPLFLRAVEVAPRSALSLNNLGALYGRRALAANEKGNKREADRLFLVANDYMEKTVQAAPRYSAFWSSLVITRINIGNLNGAIDAATRMLEAAKLENKRNQQRSAPTAAVVGRILLKANRLEEAKTALEFSIAHGGIGDDPMAKETADPEADLAEVLRRLAAASTQPTTQPLPAPPSNPASPG